MRYTHHLEIAIWPYFCVGMEPGNPLGHGTPVALETAELTLMDLGLAPLTADNDADHERGEMDINRHYR